MTPRRRADRTVAAETEDEGEKCHFCGGWGERVIDTSRGTVSRCKACRGTGKQTASPSSRPHHQGEKP